MEYEFMRSLLSPLHVTSFLRYKSFFSEAGLLKFTEGRNKIDKGALKILEEQLRLTKEGQEQLDTRCEINSCFDSVTPNLEPADNQNTAEIDILENLVAQGRSSQTNGKWADSLTTLESIQNKHR